MLPSETSRKDKASRVASGPSPDAGVALVVARMGAWASPPDLKHWGEVDFAYLNSSKISRGKKSVIPCEEVDVL